jgi:hypothetical protein
MRKILTISLIIALVTGTLLLTGCKKSEETQEYKITVYLESGVTGTPEAGTHEYSQNEQVAYEYGLERGYVDLQVSLDSATVDSSGVVTVTGAHSLNAYCEPDPEAFALNVSVAGGVEGSPASGVYYYYPGDQVDYNYTLLEDYQDLSVELDGDPISTSGTINMDADHLLVVSATLHYDVTGTWLMTEEYNDDSSFSVTLTFTGDDLSGTVTDSDGGIGTYTVNGTLVEFNLEFPEISYEYSGFLTTEDNMSGYADRKLPDGTTVSGTYNAVRTSDILQSQGGSRKGKGNLR